MLTVYIKHLKKIKLNYGFANRDKVEAFDFVIGIGTFLPEVIKIILNEIPIDSEKQEDCINFHIH
ncbi:hypothetical protein [Borreliella lanei]|uniref:Uncharacterized protein n=1 Tax=Borreliella lanei TaxID=373540 RepID=A0A7W9ZC39_9SPIR|nr:hypothetical protein [Borreliella lanei]MBB6208520.1 hypothetical protein [Borreliella lanei]